MMMKSKAIAFLLSFALACSFMGGCSSRSIEEPDFSGVREIAELASLECYYHNVVRYHRDADGFLFGLGSIGEKNMWFEYDGVVRMGVNVEEVTIFAPDANSVVTVAIPEVQILGSPDIDTESMTDPIEANGFLTSLTSEEKKKALNDAQNNLLETADSDDRAKLQAKERAKALIEQYVKNAGEAIGKTYTIKWIEAEQG